MKQVFHIYPTHWNNDGKGYPAPLLAVVLPTETVLRKNLPEKILTLCETLRPHNLLHQETQ